ncbi:carbohydrate-binding family 9-like protein [Labilibaculum antarcticum]|uniref:Carbohydrate-binding domain-containing protein n=1 Tax=Labilibaculum antarcticum TaxID=1717717 RepID=A0A1Y1CDU7_9BACT|nr:carbohydrate-binding family 9-like protein [Labilibaculum antarcticum]BAX78504.1 hypothetical protein ALGA_0109 [Labilibaculum antarcticum]
MKLSSGFRKVLIVVFACVLVMPTLQAQDKNNLFLGEQELFKASKNTSTVTVDGKMDEASWKETEVRALDFFYNIEQASDQQNTSFRMMWDDENLYVFFDCKDQYITARETKRDGAPYFDDCAEIFLIPAPDSLNMHFGFELNLYKTANDFIYLNNMNKGENAVIKGYNPDYKTAVSIQGTVNDNSDIDTGWCMEMAIPLSVFKGVGYAPIAEGVQWAFLAVRQNRDDAKGDRRSTSTIFSIYDIEKNVHQPNRFGLVEFVK